MEVQAGVIFRCRVCRQRRRDRTAPALGRVERGPDGVLRPYRLERVGQPLWPLTLGVSPLGDARWVIDPRGRTARFYEPWHRTLRLPCQDCKRPPALVQWERRAKRALAQGVAEIDV